MFKRLFDILLSLLGLFLAWPFMLAIGLLILVRDGSPMFYISERMKTPQLAFQLIKFRTMTVVPDDQNLGVTGGDKADRATKTGDRLRRYRLDELPQLINILKGDMSFVGPRPTRRQYVERFPELYAQIYRNKPGITGLATLHIHDYEARLLSETATEEETEVIYQRRCIPRKATLDLIYQRHASLCFDVVILWQTIRKVLGR